MGRQSTSKLRKLINLWVEGGVPEPCLLDAGVVFVVPSATESGGYYLVTSLIDRKKGSSYWACSCKGFRFSAEDKCRHVTSIDGHEGEVGDVEKIVRPKRVKK